MKSTADTLQKIQDAKLQLQKIKLSGIQLLDKVSKSVNAAQALNAAKASIEETKALIVVDFPTTCQGLETLFDEVRQHKVLPVADIDRAEQHQISRIQHQQVHAEVQQLRQFVDDITYRVCASASEDGNKRQRVNTGVPGQDQAQELQAVVSQVDAMEGVSASLLDSSGKLTADVKQTCYVELRFGSFMHILIPLASPGQPDPCRVGFYAPDEPTADGWVPSKYVVYRRTSAVANEALAYLQTRVAALSSDAAQLDPLAPAPPLSPASTATYHLLLWLVTYSDLFSRPCSATGRLLAVDPSSSHLLPPVFRPYRLSGAELHAAATNPKLRRAYHLATVPEIGKQ